MSDGTHLHPLQDAALEEEEEEELGLPSTSPLTTSQAATHRHSGELSTGAGLLPRSPGAKITRAARPTGDAEDEFALDIAFVTAKRCPTSTLTQTPASASRGAASRLGRDEVLRHKTAQPQATLPAGRGEEGHQLSIAGMWEKAEAASLNKYQGSDIIDDTDRPQDETEYVAWLARDAFRRQHIRLS